MFAENERALVSRFKNALKAEQSALASESWRRLESLAERWPHVGTDASLQSEISEVTQEPTPYRLATLAYAHGYFGLRQAIALDSLRYAIDTAFERSRVDACDRQWLLVAWLQTASRVAATPGHFAQFLKAHDLPSFVRVRQCRRRVVWDQFMLELERLAPYGNSSWRRRNRVFQDDATALVSELTQQELRPAVVYADPPYSRAQYSRYYHVLETLADYRYPRVSGIGRYAEGRFQTPFSNKSGVVEAFERLAGGIANLGSDLILSYPANGLLQQAGSDPGRILRRHFKSVRRYSAGWFAHSTLGAAPGRATTAVNEFLFVANGGY